MTFQDIQRYIYRRTGHPDSPVTEVSNRVKQYINERHKELLTRNGMNILRRAVVTFASDTTNSEYALPSSVSRILGIHERNNDFALEHLSLADYRALQADPSAFEGTPSFWTDLGRSPVKKQPSNASELFWISTSASDTNVTGSLTVVEDNNWQRTITSGKFNGTTAVSADTSANEVTQVMDLYLSAAPVGNIELREDSGTGTVLAEIRKGQTSIMYPLIALSPKPASAVTYYVDAVTRIEDMTAANDEPLLPEDFHWVLAEMALHDELMKKEKSAEADKALIKAEGGFREMRNHVTNPPDFLPVQGASRFRGVSRLGPFYPADRIVG